MSRAPDTAYELPDHLPIEPIAPGSTVLVAGPAFSHAEDVARSMVASATDFDERALFISTNQTCEKFLAACRQSHPAFDDSRVAVIDCSGQEIGQSPLDIQVKYVSTQSDLTGIGMKFSALYQSLYADAVDGRVRTGLLSLSSLAMYVDLRRLFQFAQTLSGRIDSAGGLSVFGLDPSTHDTKTVNTLSQVADGRIEVREPAESVEADGELRIQGLRGQPEGWQPFSLPSE
jgi:hypothetical protein